MKIFNTQFIASVTDPEKHYYSFPGEDGETVLVPLTAQLVNNAFEKVIVEMGLTPEVAKTHILDEGLSMTMYIDGQPVLLDDLRNAWRAIKKVRAYAEDRAFHGKTHLNTVNSGRIADDLFAIIGKETSDG